MTGEGGQHIAGLAPEVRAELERRLLEKRAQSTRRERIPPRDDARGSVLLSSAQKRLWFLDQLEPSSSTYIVSRAYRLLGHLDFSALKTALTEIVERHEALRTVFDASEGEPFQRVVDAGCVDVAVFDVGEEELSERLAAEAGRAMDLTTGPLMRVCLMRIDDREHAMLICVHHIVFDGWSVGVFLHELGVRYDAHRIGEPVSFPELPIQYADYAQWQRRRLHSAAAKIRRAYWKDHLRDAPSLLELPTDRARPEVQSSRGSQTRWALEPELVQGLRDISRREKVTLFMTLLTAFAVLLHRYSGQDDLCVGSPSAGRNRLELENLIGLFVNTLALRVRVTPEATFRELLHHVRNITLEAFENQDVPFEQVVEDVLPERHLNASPIFQVMFALQSVPRVSLRLGGLEIEPLDTHNRTSKFDLSLYLYEEDDRLEARAEYSSDLFDGETIARMLKSYQTLLEAIVVETNGLVSRLPLLTTDERTRLLVEWNDTARAYGPSASIAELFEAQVERSPNGVALVHEGRSLSYRELDSRANSVAGRLVRMEVKPGDLVGVHLERSPEMIVALLGILKAGAAYVPLDPEYPEERLGFMVRDANLSLVVTHERLAPSIANSGAQVVVLESDAADSATGGEWTGTRRTDPDEPAYVIYTSGSTGTPKGVLGLHRGTVNRLRWMWETYPFEADEVCCLKTSMNFVDSVAELFGPLLGGIPIVVVTDADVIDPARLVRTLAEHEVTRILLVPSLLKLLLDTQGAIGGKLPRLRTWTCSGEALSPELVSRFRSSVPGARLLNLYGSSEVSADATYFDTSDLVDEPASVPIGRPIANMGVYLLDGNLEPVPVGVEGELYIGGVGVSRGYLHRPDLTNERFMLNPHDATRYATLFKSGDRGRFRADGNLVYLGRDDHQIKIRGSRVEPGEIEHALRRHTCVHETVVVSREDDNGDPSLVAYVVPETGRLCDTKELRSFLRKRVPDYMLPSTFVTLDALPLTPSGKVDRLALPPPSEVRGKVRRFMAEPSTENEIRMGRLWEDLLGVHPVSACDDFFEIGGHSFLAMRLVMRIHDEFGCDLPVVDVFRTPTVRELARLVDAGEERDGTKDSCIVPIQPRGSDPPFFFTGLGGGHHPRNLSRQLGDERPFYAILTLEDMNGESTEDLSVSDMAARYLTAVRGVQPEGPYFLGAFCGQGIVGYEMARQLESQQQEVAFLGIFEARAPGRRTFTQHIRHIVRRDTLRLKSHWNNVRRVPLAGKIQYGLEMVRSFTGRSRLRLIRAAETLRYKYYVRTGRPIPDEMRRAWSVRASVRQEYVPEPLKARITLFLGRKSHHMQDNVQGWDALTDGGVEVHMISGAHARMLEAPHVVELGECLDTCLREAESGRLGGGSSG